MLSGGLNENLSVVCGNQLAIYMETLSTMTLELE